MWVEKLPNGKVRYAERYENPLTMKLCKISVVMDKDTKANRKLAQMTLQEKICEKVKGLSAELRRENLSLFELYEIYFQYLNSAVKKSTYARNRTAANSMMDILGRETVVDNLTARYVKNRLFEKQEKPGTTNERIKRFKAMLRWAYENELVSDIRWLDKLKPLKDDEKKKKLEEKFLESEELTRLLENLKIAKWRFLAELMALSGMRCGEAIALDDMDVDFENRKITISKTYDVVHKIVTTPKTEDSNREIYMQDQLYILCKKIKKEMAKERMLMGYRTKLFMSDSNGGYLEYPAFNKYLSETAFKVLNKKVTTHFMRHTHVALLAEQGISLDVIARRLGHSDSKITERIYFHITQKLREKDNEQLKNVHII